MKRIAAALTGFVALSGCGEPAPTPTESTKPPLAATDHADEWLSFADTGSGPPYAAINLHETGAGHAGFVVARDGSAHPIRNIKRSDTALSFFIPALGVSYAGESSGDGAWSGRWAEPGKADVSVSLAPAAAPPQTFQGNLVHLPDGRRMHMICSGQGEPVVLLDYGAGSSMKQGWSDLAAPIAAAARTRVCAYDRAGRGISDPATTPRDAFAVADDILHLANNAGFASPIVLVGHSLGSYHVRAFANGQAIRTAGLVLVDPSGDGQLDRLKTVAPKLVEMDMSGFMAQGELDCVNRLRATPVPPDDPLAKQCGGNDPENIWAFRSEVEHMPGASTSQLVKSRRSYADMPLIVLTRTDYDTGWPPHIPEQEKQGLRPVWEAMNAEMAALSTRGEQRFVEGAGHSIQNDKPEAIAQAVADVVAAVRAGPK